MAMILVVDDEAVIRDFLVRVLRREGYEVHAATSGREALRYLEEAPYDLLLSDIKMNNLDGIALLKEAKARYPDLSIILLTGHATVSSAVEALQQGAHNYLLKPAKNEDILNAIQDGLKRRTRQQRRNHLESVASQLLDLVQPDEGTRAAGQDIVGCHGLELDTAAYKASLDGEPLELTPTEFRLLLELSRNPGATLDYVELVRAACGYTCSRQEAREIIGAHVRNVRRKLDVDPGQPLYVESIRGIGYRLICEEE